MIIFFVSLLFSVFTAFGMAIALVEKGNEFPIKIYRLYLQIFLRKIHWKMPRMLFCSTCTSFWTSLFSDFAMYLLNICVFKSFYFFWPFSGFITLGLTWTIIEFLNKKQNITISFTEDK